MPMQERYEFGELAMEVAERRLSRDGHTISLTPKAYDVLVHLVRQRRTAGHQTGIARRRLGRCVRRRGDPLGARLRTPQGAGGRQRTRRATSRPSPGGISFHRQRSRHWTGSTASRGAVRDRRVAGTTDGRSDIRVDRSVGLGIADAVIAGLGRFHDISRCGRHVRSTPRRIPPRTLVGRRASLGVDAVVARDSTSTAKGAMARNCSISMPRTRTARRLWNGKAFQMRSLNRSLRCCRPGVCNSIGRRVRELGCCFAVPAGPAGEPARSL